MVSTDASLTGNAITKGDVVSYTLTPFDGEDEGPSVTSPTLTIFNSPPLQRRPTTVRLVQTNDILTAARVGTDADSNALIGTFVWTVDGAAVSATGAALGGSTWFDKDESVNVTVTLSDGTAASAVSGTAVTVENSLPTGLAVGIDPSSPGDDDDLLCDITTAAVDADGDTLVYTTAWTLNGSAWTSRRARRRSPTTLHSDSDIDG